MLTRILIKNGDIVLKDTLIRSGSLLVEGPKIAGLGRFLRKPEDVQVIDANGCFVSPGFIDTHIHGEPEKIFTNEVPFGTTAIVIAESCSPGAETAERIEKIKEFKRRSPLGKNVLGVRPEGPFISRKRRGAQNARYISRPSRKTLWQIIKKCGGLLKIMTIAPEVKGALPLIQLLKKKRIIASIGHSDATYEEALKGIEAGISHATHVFNAMALYQSRLRRSGTGQAGAASAVLTSRNVKAEIILDLVHVHKALFFLLILAKGFDDVILVTDSIRAGLPRGIKKVGGVYRLKNGRLAGSCLTMIGALKNAVVEGGLKLTDAIKLATINPATLLGVQNRKGMIAVGKDADLVIFDKNFDVKMTMINGKIAYRRKTQ